MSKATDAQIANIHGMVRRSIKEISSDPLLTDVPKEELFRAMMLSLCLEMRDAGIPVGKNLTANLVVMTMLEIPECDVGRALLAGRPLEGS